MNPLLIVQLSLLAIQIAAMFIMFRSECGTRKHRVCCFLTRWLALPGLALMCVIVYQGWPKLFP